VARALEQILGYVYLTGLIEAIKTGIPDLLPPAFYNTKSQTVKDQGLYTRTEGRRTLARRVEYGAPAVERELQTIGTLPVKLVHQFEFINLKVTDYMSLRNYTDYNQQNLGLQEIDRQAVQFRTLFDNSEKAAIYSMLANGNIWFDSKGNLLPSSSGAAVTVNYGVQSYNQGQLQDVFGSTILDLGWQNATANIPYHIAKIRKTSRERTGYEIENCFYGVEVPNLLANNTLVQSFLSRSAARDGRSPGMEYLETGEIPQGLFKIKNWIPMGEAFYVDASGNTQEFWGADLCVFTPSIDSAIYEFMQGTYPAPRSFQPAASLAQAVGSFEMILGMGSYAVPIMNPMTAQLFYFNTYLPIWKVPDALFQATVRF
jgi:hypothetical protein